MASRTSSYWATFGARLQVRRRPQCSTARTRVSRRRQRTLRRRAGAPVSCRHAQTVDCAEPLFADFNADGRPDMFLACSGWDVSPWPGEQNRLYLSRRKAGGETPPPRCRSSATATSLDGGRRSQRARPRRHLRRQRLPSGLIRNPSLHPAEHRERTVHADEHQHSGRHGPVLDTWTEHVSPARRSPISTTTGCPSSS